MTVITLYALFAEDIVMMTTSVDFDPYFFSGLVISFILFLLELLLQSCVVDDFKYSFFFWLDFVATFSLVIDIPWFTDVIKYYLDQDQSPYDLDVKPGVPISKSNNANMIKVFKSFRLIRLIRILKLYNYIVKSNADAEEAKLREQQKMSSNA